jgi:predicted acylesterase/phospholipase RssA
VSVDLKRIRAELERAPLVSPYPPELARAVVSDTLRLARLAPPARATWEGWSRAKKARPYLDEQLGMLAHILASTSLREEAVRTLREHAVAPDEALPSFFDKVAPLSAEMIRSNVFRQEEFLRRFVECLGGEIAGESRKQMQRRLEQLDYRKTKAEYERAEKAREAEAQRRAKLLREAAQREADARGWRE